MKDKKTQTNDNITTTVEQTVTLDPTVVPIDKLVLAPKMQAFIRQHRNDDVRTLALRAPRDAEFDLTLALEQIAGGRQRSASCPHGQRMMPLCIRRISPWSNARRSRRPVTRPRWQNA